MKNTFRTRANCEMARVNNVTCNSYTMLRKGVQRSTLSQSRLT